MIFMVPVAGSLPHVMELPTFLFESEKPPIFISLLK